MAHGSFAREEQQSAHGDGALEGHQSAHGYGAREQHTATAHVFQHIYTSHVISDEVMSLWNCSFSEMVHEVGAAVDPSLERPALIAHFTRFIVQELLMVNASLD